MINFDIKARSQTIICSTDIEQAKLYGKVYCIYPEKPYFLIYSVYVYDFIDIVTQINEITRENIYNWLANKFYEKTNDLSKIPTEFKGEVMLCCSDYIIERYN